LESILGILDPAAVKVEFARLHEALKSEIKKWTVFVYIEGMSLNNLEKLKMGSTTLYPKESGPLAIALENPRGSRILEEIGPWLKKDSEHAHCYLSIDIEGEDRFVNQAAIQHARDIVNILSLYATSSRRPAVYQSIGVIGQPAITRRQVIPKCTPPIEDGPAQAVWSYSADNPPGRFHEVDPAQEQRWRELGLDKVVESIEREETNPGSALARIRNSVTWYGRAMTARTKEEKFVGLTTALESLLVADEGQQLKISQRLADEVSGFLGGGFERRQRRKKRMKELYKLRCRIVHSGLQISLQDLYDLDGVVAKTIFAFVQREMADS
jgi:hypothetical protein